MIKPTDDVAIIDNIVERMFEDLSLVGESRGYTLEEWRSKIDYAQGSQIAHAWFDFANNLKIWSRTE